MAELALRLGDLVELVGGSAHVFQLLVRLEASYPLSLCPPRPRASMSLTRAQLQPAFEELASSEEAIVRKRVRV